MPPQVQLLWQTLDDEWAAVISHFLLGRSGAAPAPPPPPPPIASVVADAQRQRAHAAVTALEKALADASTAADERAGIAARLKSAKAELAALAGSEEEGDVRRFRDFLHLGTLLGQLLHLCQHTANMSWRLANIIQKQQPKKSFIPEPDDLYRFEVQV